MKKTQIKVSQEDAWRIYELVEEFNTFLHQPENYANPEKSSGG